MRDYWLTQYILSAIGWAYVSVVLIAVALALWLPKRSAGKMIASVVVLGLASILPLRAAREISQQQARADEFKQRYQKAKALFDERCKTAGEKVYRTVDEVEGVLLLNIRQSDRPGMSDDPRWPDAALPHEAAEDQYIRHFLYREYDGSPEGSRLNAGDRGYLSVGVSGNPTLLSRGYAYVDVRQSDGSTLRYRLKTENKPDLASEPVKGRVARYSIGFVNQVNAEDRMHWVAGTTIVLTDTYTNDVIATRESYSFERGLGSTVGGRQPWRFAVTCPAASRRLPSAYVTRFFADQILKPKQGGY